MISFIQVHSASLIHFICIFIHFFCLGVPKAPVTYNLRIDANQSLPRLTLEKEAQSISETIQVGTDPVCITKVLQAQVYLHARHPRESWEL